MLNWRHGRRPKDVTELAGQTDDLVASMRDFAFRDGVAVASDAAGVLVAHGQRSAPRRVIVDLSSATSGTPTVKVGEINGTHVRLFASAAAVVDLTFVM